MDREAFKQRMQSLKSYREQNPGKGYLDWKASLPDNLQDESSYNLQRAYELGYEPEYIEEDRFYHLPTRDQETGEILKKPWHPTFLIGLQEDAKLGYYPQTVDGTTYTTTWEGNENPIYKYKDGGEVPPTNKPTIVEPIPYKGKLYSDRYGKKYTEEQVYDYYNNGTDEIDRFTGGPLVRGLKPLLDLEDAANFTPVGDAVAAYDVYDAVSNKDWSGAGLAALGLVPFVPNIGEAVFKSSKKLSKSKNYIPKVNPNYKQSVIDRALREESTFNKIPNNVTEEIIDQRNRTYELMQEPYARNRAKEVNAQYGTDYLKVYDSMLDKYVNIDEYFKLPDPQYKKMERPTIAAQVTPAKGNTMYFNRDMIKAPEDIPSNVVLHEMGHLVDGAASMNNEFLKKLGDKSKFIPFNQAKLMYPTMTKEGYNNILQGTEIKSYMNQFRNYLNQNGKLHNGNYTGSYKGLKKEIIEAPKESFNNIKAIFNLYRSPKLFNKDFQMIPIVNNKDNRDIS